MSRIIAGSPAAILLLFLPFRLLADPRIQDRSIMDLEDAVLRAEIMELGGYQELVLEFAQPTLMELSLRSVEDNTVEFWSAGTRIRIETQAFDHPRWVKRAEHGHQLEGAPIIGWSGSDGHTRMSRLEVVLHGQVVPIPVDAFTDLFDTPLVRDGLRYVAAMRSSDGRRIYVHAQAGEGPQARMVTWVIEDGEYLFRVVDDVP